MTVTTVWWNSNWWTFFVMLLGLIFGVSGCGITGPEGIDLGPLGTLYGGGTIAGGAVQIVTGDHNQPNQPPADPLPPTLDLGQFFINGGGWQDGFSLTVNTDGEIVFELGQAVRGGQGPFKFELVNSDDGTVLMMATGGRFTYKFTGPGTFHLVIRITDANGKTVLTPVFTIIVVVPPAVEELKATITSPSSNSSWQVGKDVEFVVTVEGGVKPYSAHWLFNDKSTTDSVSLPGSPNLVKAKHSYAVPGGGINFVQITDAVGKTTAILKVTIDVHY